MEAGNDPRPLYDVERTPATAETPRASRSSPRHVAPSAGRRIAPLHYRRRDSSASTQRAQSAPLHQTITSSLKRGCFTL